MLLKFLSVVSIGIVLASEEKRSNTCPNFACVPGLDSLGIGIDVVNGDFKAQSLFDLSFTGDKIWTNPFFPLLQYAVPDQVQVVATTSSGSTSNLYRTSTEYANSLSHGAGVEGGWGAVFSGSAEVNHAKSFLSSGSTVLSVTEEVVKLNSLSLLPPPLLKISSALTAAISRHLPLVYDERAYTTFASYYGTHYVTSATYGGKATMMSSVQETYLGENSDLVATANAKVHFQALKGDADVGGSFSHGSSSKDYQKACTNSWQTRMVGGNSHLNMTQWEKWTESVKLAPAQISFRVVSLDRLMPDETRANNFRRFLTAYYAKNNHTDTPKPKPPIRLSRCQCTSFPYDGTNPHKDSLLVGMENPRSDRIGGTREACVPCYSLAGKFGGGAKATANKRSVEEKRDVEQFWGPTTQQPWQPFTTPPPLTTTKPMPTPVPHNSTCGVLQCIPGMDSIGVGFDALSGELRDLRVVKFNYNKGNVWKNPFYPSLMYNFADEVSVVTKTSSNQYSAIYNDTISYANDLANKAGLSAGAGAYAASLDVQQSRNKLSGSQAVLAVLEHELTIYEIDIAAYPTPSDALRAMEAWLPMPYQPEAYAQFVSHFGTHFIAEGRFGGTARQRSTVDQHFFTNNAGSEVAAGVNGQYANFKAGVKVNRTSSEGMKSFANNSISEITLLGGNYEGLRVSDWDKWQDTTRLAPAATSIKLHPIWELFKDSTKASHMKKHIDAYLANGAKAYKPVAVSTQHPEGVADSKLKNGQECSQQGAFLTDFGMNVPIVHTALSPQECRKIGWSKAPRGSLAKNSPLQVCGQYKTNQPYCDRGGFMQTATYDVTALGSWAVPITCAHLCYAQE